MAREWRFIQTIIQERTPTARKRMAACSTSCVSGSSMVIAPRDAAAHATAAATAAPAPSQTQRMPARCPLRPRYVSRIPTIRAASSVSRHMMSRVWIIGRSLHDEHAFALGMEVVEELVAAGAQPGEVDGDPLAGLDDPLAVQLEALELDGRGGLVRDVEADLGAARRLDLGRREPAVVHGQRDGDVVGAGQYRCGEEEGRRRQLKTHFNFT